MFVFSEPSIATICINETVFHEESGCPYGDVPSPLFLPSFFNISIFDDFPFVYSYLIKPFDSKRKHPVLFFRLNCEVPGSLVFFLNVRGLGLCDVIPLSTRVTSLFEFSDRYLCIQHGYAKHPDFLVCFVFLSEGVWDFYFLIGERGPSGIWDLKNA